MTTDAVPVPELAPAAVEQWRAEGAPLVELLARARRGVGGVAAFRLDGPGPTVLVTDPAAVQHVLGHHPDRYVKRSHRARMLVGDGVLSATGEAWKRQRRLLQSQFTGPGMRRYEQRIAAAARRTAVRWEGYRRSGETFDVAEEMRGFALDTVWRALTGSGLDDRTDAELRAVERVVAAMPTLPTGAADARDAVAEDLARIDVVARAAIDAARSRPAAEPDGPDGPDEPGVLRVLLDAADEHPEYTDRLIRDELVTLLVAGHETTATTLTWLFLLLDGNPGARGADPQALVAETLRLYPAAWLLPRHALEDDVLAGHRIAAGTDVLVCPYLIHRDPELWPDPERFDPTRFAPGAARPGQGAYLPFGLGARACLGTRFAVQETTALLELLLPLGRLEFRSRPAGAAYSITVRPDGPTPAVLRP
ncbi:cytochrome P450 [Kitasatospora sp. NPDC089797]|uniref:cytochrome P450 n=1 Tax=Kitasatospora sp. NPDC089797 TaxID=3155298 RepID=UPI0034419798